MADYELQSKSERHYRYFRYTALGDSTAFGVGATDNYGYVNYFRDFLRTGYRCVDLTNYAAPGFTSASLLNQLKEDATVRRSVKKADVITISIGGANLLNCVIDGPDINDTCAANGVLTFIHDWPQILYQIRNSIGSRAEILVTTVYNPLIGAAPNYSKIDNYIQQINYVINNLAYRFMYDYRVADVHEDFQGLFPDGSWKVCTWTHSCEPTPDPHPTNSGHIEIARLHEVIY